MRRPVFAVVALATALILTGSPTAAATFPEQIPLPNGFYPEGIEVGTGHDFYVGSLLNGAVYKGDLRTGEGDVLTAGVPGRFIAGLSFDRRSGLLWAVGGDISGQHAFAFDVRSGRLVHQVPIPGAFINDVIAARNALYITDSMAPVFWVVPLTNRGAPAGPARDVPLTGDFQFVATGDLPINLNGVAVTPNGRTLIAVHSLLGVLYRIDPATGRATEIDLGGDAVPFGDGIVLHGRRLYVVQNFPNTLAVVELKPDLTTGAVVDRITSDLFRVPATGARFGDSLYLVNARFDVAVPPLLGGERTSIDYDIVKVPVR